MILKLSITGGFPCLWRGKRVRFHGGERKRSARRVPSTQSEFAGGALLRARQLCAIDLFGLSREIVEVGE